MVSQLFAAGIFIIMFAFIISGKVERCIPALVGAAAMLIIVFGFCMHSFEAIWDTINLKCFVTKEFWYAPGVAESSSSGINWATILFFFGMMVLVEGMGEVGFFRWLCLKLAKLVKYKVIPIFITFMFLSAFLAMFIDSITVVLFLTAITVELSGLLKFNPVYMILPEIFCANLGGAATMSGDPPNIIIGSAAGFSFMDFVYNLTLPIAIILALVLTVLTLIFKKKLHADPEKMKEVANIDNSKTITDKALMIRSISVLALVILGFVTHDITHIETCVAAMLGASFLLLFEKPTDILRDVEWNTIFFFIGLFIIIGGVEASGGIKLMAEWILRVTQGSQEAASMLILWASGIISGIIDNIPYTATMSPMLVEIQKSMGADYTVPLWWCLSLGACLGGNLTMIGAAANVIVSESAAKEGHPIAFLRFMKYGILVVLISLVISSIFIKLAYL